MKHYIRAFALVASAAAWPTGVFAQNASTPPAPSSSQQEGDVNLSDIVVVALKQGDTALQAPATITIVEPDTLTSKNVVAANQLNAIVPGLTMSVGVGGLPGTSFRGLGSNAAVFGLEPSVAEYIDGAYMPHARDYVAPLYDLDHIEFIKGTQSTLLGKNTSLGAISLINNRPGKEFDYALNYTHSFTIDGNRIDGAVNLPIGDTFQVRAAFLASRDRGYADNLYRGRSEPIQNDQSGRLSFAWQPTSDLDVYASYQRDHRVLRGQVIGVLTDPVGVVAARANAVGVPFNTLATDINGSGSGALGGAVLGTEPFDRQNTNRLNAIIDYRVGEFTLTSQTAYSSWYSPRSTDLDFTAANLFNIVDDERSRTFSQELRLASPRAGRLQYLVGLYYFHNSWNYGRVLASSPSNTIGFPFTGQAASRTVLPTRTYSPFVSGSFEIVDHLKIDAGVRYTHEKKEGTFERNSTGTLAGPFPTTPFSTYAPQVTEPVDFNIGLRYQATPDLLFYGSYSKGSKSGGYQDAPTTIAGAPFAPETAYSSEIGAKLRLPSGYVTAALFNTRVKDFQTSYTNPVGTPPIPQPVVGNANVRSRGFEANLSYRLIPGLTFNGNVVYAKSVFTDPFPANATIAGDGDTLTRAPKWSGNADLGYEHNVGGNLAAFAGVRGDFSSRTLFQFQVAQPTAPSGDAHKTIDAWIGLRDADKRWEVALTGTNLTDRRYVEFATAISAAGGAYYGSFNRPRVIALEFKINR